MLNSTQIVAGLMQELRRGTLILLTLSCLKTPMYGYNLIKELEKYNISIEANTLYPLMRRLEGQGLLLSEWEVTQAKPRKYYKLTALGAEVLEKAAEEWRAFSANVENILNGGIAHDDK